MLFLDAVLSQCVAPARSCASYSMMVFRNYVRIAPSILEKLEYNFSRESEEFFHGPVSLFLLFYRDTGPFSSLQQLLYSTELGGLQRYKMYTRLLSDFEIFTFSFPQVVFSRELVSFSPLLNFSHIEDQGNL